MNNTAQKNTSYVDGLVPLDALDTIAADLVCTFNTRIVEDQKRNLGTFAGSPTDPLRPDERELYNQSVRRLAFVLVAREKERESAVRVARKFLELIRQLEASGEEFSLAMFRDGVTAIAREEGVA